MLALVTIAALSQTCSQRKTCGECAAPSSEGAPCFWCYDHGASGCKEIGLHTIGKCENFTFESANCACEPKERNTCDKCAGLSHLGCVWSNVTTNLTISVDTIKTTVPIYSSTSCRVGNPITGPGTTTRNATWSVLGVSFSMALVAQPTAFYWGQCKLAGPGPAALGLGVIICIGCAVCSLCKCISRRRRRARARSYLLHDAGHLQAPRLG